MLKPGYHHLDCMEGMLAIPDKYFDIAIVDPPYFKGPNNRQFYGKKVSNTGIHRVYRPITSWELPDEKYFKELLRVSKNQIVWGCNYFNYYLGPGRIVWDKCNGSNTFSDAEIAYTSFHDSTRLFRYLWNGMFQGKSITEGHLQQGNKSINEKRIHPTQKPVMLYKWLLMQYAKQGDKILDTHTGSASSLIACYDMGFDYLAFEKDEDMYNLSSSRLHEHMSQIKLTL